MNRINLCILACVIFLFTHVLAGKKHYNVSEEDWNRQFSKGKWDYIGRVAVERARSAVITGVFAKGKQQILDVGCGEGALVDYMTETQKKYYTGIDISKEALKIAKKKRPNQKFLLATAESYEPSAPFDMIVFNEMLYYVDQEEILKKYSGPKYLNPGGIIVISCWYMEKTTYLRDSIFADARRILKSIDAIDISGTTDKGRNKQAISFHIEGFSPIPLPGK